MFLMQNITISSKFIKPGSKKENDNYTSKAGCIFKMQKYIRWNELFPGGIGSNLSLQRTFEMSTPARGTGG